jgi:hypothetical protein
MNVTIDADEVLKAFDRLQVKEQDQVVKKAIFKGANILTAKAQINFYNNLSRHRRDVSDAGVIKAVRSGSISQGLYVMMKSIGITYNKRKQRASIHPLKLNSEYSIMTPWFIAGTKDRTAHSYVRRKRSNGTLTKRRYKNKNVKLNRGKIEGNDAIAIAYDQNLDKINAAIQEEYITQICKKFYGK